MYATVSISVAEHKALAIPRSAMLRLGEQTVVFVQTGTAPNGLIRFERRPVAVDEDEGGDYLPVTHGLERGEKIVTSARSSCWNICEQEAQCWTKVSGPGDHEPMIQRLVALALRMPVDRRASSPSDPHRAGSTAYKNLDIEAYPNPVPPLVEIITQPNGWSAEEVERYVTVPLEIGLSGMPGLDHIRSQSLFGL